MEDTAMKFLGAGIAMIGALGGGIGIGQVVAGWLGALARNPGAEGKLFLPGILGLAFAEVIALLCLLVAILLLFVV